MAEEQVGTVSQYFARIGVAGINVTASLRVGDRIHVKGHTTDFEQVVESMQMDHGPVQEAKSGESVGIKVMDRVRDGDHVFRVT